MHSPSASTSRRGTANPRNGQSGARAAPYMVALSGWPEPVYIDTHGVGAARAARSRSGTPGSSISGPSGESAKSKQGGDRSLGLKMTPATGADQPEGGSGQSTRPITPIAGPTITEALYPYLHSNTRPKPASRPATPTASAAQPRPTLPQTPPIQAAPTPQPPNTHNAPNQFSGSGKSSYRARFADPRFTPHASVLGEQGGHLRVAPSWTNSVPPSASRVLLKTYDPSPAYSSIRTQHPSDREAEEKAEAAAVGAHATARSSSVGVGGRMLQLGSMRGKTQAVILRSTPEVYPPPHSSGGSSAGGLVGWARAEPAVGVATEVYPRDPESMLLWPGIEAGKESRGSQPGTGTHTPIRPGSPNSDSVPGSSRNHKRYPVSALSPEQQGGWSPTVPWDDEGGEGGGVSNGGRVAQAESNDRMEVD